MPPPYGRRPVVETIENDASHHGFLLAITVIHGFDLWWPDFTLEKPAFINADSISSTV
jgi:hypothetical protein